MYKLSGINIDGSTKFEQVFQDYNSMKAKELDLSKEGITTVVTPMTTEQHEKHSETLLKQVIGLYDDVLLN